MKIHDFEDVKLLIEKHNTLTQMLDENSLAIKYGKWAEVWFHGDDARNLQDCIRKEIKIVETQLTYLGVKV